MTLLDQIASLLQDPEISDIHPIAGQPLWFRRNGAMMCLEGSAPLTCEEVEGLLEYITQKRVTAKTLAAANRAEDDFGATFNNVRMRGNYYLQRGLPAIALRKYRDKIPDLDALGVNAHRLKQMVSCAKGLFLVTGSTGSGKSTTLAALLNYINTTRPCRILTVEDPIEYILESDMANIVQREIGDGHDVRNFATAMRYAMRQDPDVVMIGEMRDKETVWAAVNAANTGHLVLSTLHTMNARQSVDRILSFYPADEKEWAAQLLSSVLIGIQSQVLVPTVDGSRTMAYELLVNTSAVRNAIKEQKTQQIANIMETGSKDGQSLLNARLLSLIKEGVISVDEAMFHTYDPEGLSSDLSRR